MARQSDEYAQHCIGSDDRCCAGHDAELDGLAHAMVCLMRGLVRLLALPGAAHTDTRPQMTVHHAWHGIAADDVAQRARLARALGAPALLHLCGTVPLPCTSRAALRVSAWLAVACGSAFALALEVVAGEGDKGAALSALMLLARLLCDERGYVASLLAIAAPHGGVGSAAPHSRPPSKILLGSATDALSDDRVLLGGGGSGGSGEGISKSPLITVLSSAQQSTHATNASSQSDGPDTPDSLGGSLCAALGRSEAEAAPLYCALLCADWVRAATRWATAGSDVSQGVRHALPALVRLPAPRPTPASSTTRLRRHRRPALAPVRCRCRLRAAAVAHARHPRCPRYCLLASAPRLPAASAWAVGAARSDAGTRASGAAGS